MSDKARGAGAAPGDEEKKTFLTEPNLKGCDHRPHAPSNSQRHADRGGRWHAVWQAGPAGSGVWLQLSGQRTTAARLLPVAGIVAPPPSPLPVTSTPHALLLRSRQ